MSDLPDRLREAAAGLSDNLGGSVTAAESVHLMRMAADTLEGLEQALLDIVGWENWQTPTWREIARNALPEHAEREILKREAVESETAPTIDIPWPLIPIPQDYPTMFEYTAAMVEWGKRVSRLHRAPR